MFEPIRMFCYILGIIASAVLAGQLFRIRYPLARLLAVAMGAWLVNCVTLAALLYLSVTGAALPSWRGWLLMINAILLAVMPMIIYFWFARNGNEVDA